MHSNEIRKRFLAFFEKRGHAILESAPLVPKNDPSVLFNTAGMQPLVPYLLGQAHPMGTRLADAQKCVRTVDIDEVGDNRHLTFFEMLGNWSLGDYFKEETIQWSYEFLTSKDEGLGLDPARLYVTVFEGDTNAPRDEEAAAIWKKYLPEGRVYYLPAKNNWWSVGDNGPCGPDTEIFYDINQIAIGDMSHDEFVKADDEGRVVEIWNNVFMTYETKDGAVVGALQQKNIDTGMGFERVVMVAQNVSTVFDTDIFKTIIDNIKYQSGNKDNEISARIIADHARTAMFLVADGVTPSNKDRGYILRRLIRRAVMQAHNLGIGLQNHFISNTASDFVDMYQEVYPEVKNPSILKTISEEEDKFVKTIEQGLKEFEKTWDIEKTLNSEGDENLKAVKYLSAKAAFNLFTTYGFPVELTIELAKKKGVTVDLENLRKLIEDHQKLSQTASAGMFKGGLANHNEKTIQLHTAHHLLLAALQNVVDPSIKQRGSNITEERLRIDFLCDHKLTDDEKKKVEDWVNEQIKANLTVVRREMPLTEAQRIGAEMEFGAKYPETVSVYFIEDEKGNHISKEFCGGPHVEHTGELGHFKIQKEEAVSAGVRRIKAILE